MDDGRCEKFAVAYHLIVFKIVFTFLSLCEVLAAQISTQVLKKVFHFSKNGVTLFLK